MPSCHTKEAKAKRLTELSEETMIVHEVTTLCYIGEGCKEARGGQGRAEEGRGGQGRVEEDRECLERPWETRGGQENTGGQGRAEGLSVADLGYPLLLAYWYSICHQVYPSCSRTK